jgi:PKD repeat protein
MVQAVDAAGNVGVSTSKGLFTTQNTAPANPEIDAPRNPVMVGGAVNASARFIDQPGDTHTATWDWGDGLLSDGNVVEPGIVDEPGIKTYFVSGEHTYNAAGVYTVTLTVSDNRGQSAETTFHVVVYAWWFIILIIVAIGLIIWGIVWGRRRRRKGHQQA